MRWSPCAWCVPPPRPGGPQTEIGKTPGSVKSAGFDQAGGLPGVCLWRGWPKGPQTETGKTPGSVKASCFEAFTRVEVFLVSVCGEAGPRGRRQRSEIPPARSNPMVVRLRPNWTSSWCLFAVRLAQGATDRDRTEPRPGQIQWIRPGNCHTTPAATA